MNKKNIIVTGARGFIGKNLINSLKEKYIIKKLSFEKFGKIKDIDKKKYIDNFIKKNKPFAVIHLATYFSKINNKKTFLKCMKVNYFFSKILYQSTVKNSVNKFIYTGSNYENIKDKKKLYPYILSKKRYSSFLEKSNSKKTNLICLYLSSIYGDNDERKKIVSYLFKIKKTKKKINFKILKYSKLNFMHIKDLIEIIKLCILKKPSNKKLFYNLKFKKNFSLLKIILNFSKINKYITYEILKNSIKNLEIDERDVLYKNKKFLSYEPKIDINNWIKNKLSISNY